MRSLGATRAVTSCSCHSPFRRAASHPFISQPMSKLLPIRQKPRDRHSELFRVIAVKGMYQTVDRNIVNQWGWKLRSPPVDVELTRCSEQSPAVSKVADDQLHVGDTAPLGLWDHILPQPRPTTSRYHAVIPEAVGNAAGRRSRQPHASHQFCQSCALA